MIPPKPSTSRYIAPRGWQKSCLYDSLPEVWLEKEARSTDSLEYCILFGLNYFEGSKRLLEIVRKASWLWMRSIAYLLQCVIILLYSTWCCSRQQQGYLPSSPHNMILAARALDCDRRIASFPVLNSIASTRPCCLTLLGVTSYQYARGKPISFIDELRGGCDPEEGEKTSCKDEQGQGLQGSDTAPSSQGDDPHSIKDEQHLSVSPDIDGHQSDSADIENDTCDKSPNEHPQRPIDEATTSQREYSLANGSIPVSQEPRDFVGVSSNTTEGTNSTEELLLPWELSPGVNITDEHVLGRRLIRACASGRVNDGRDLILCGAYVDYRIVPANEEEEGSELVTWTPLMHAAASGRTATCSMLLRLGANISARDEFGATALHVAADRGKSATCTALLDMGADVTARTHPGNFTPLHYAAMRGFRNTVQALVRLGAEVGFLYG
jgi:hypothetical protein